ncbi:hypothetical protein PUN28_010598 [Cardiocondyla obscurior]|uniref:Uncharacterized protein n=1 Tax=Cardiocondyla obscurior TaxID=286306 RepID=A0AAW2FGM1_9HYME
MHFGLYVKKFRSILRIGSHSRSCTYGIFSHSRSITSGKRRERELFSLITAQSNNINEYYSPNSSQNNHALSRQSKSDRYTTNIIQSKYEHRNWTVETAFCRKKKNFNRGKQSKSHFDGFFWYDSSDCLQECNRNFDELFVDYEYSCYVIQIASLIPG